MTNFEAIKAMPEELLAVFLASLTTKECDGCPRNTYCYKAKCRDGMLEWLRSEET